MNQHTHIHTHTHTTHTHSLPPSLAETIMNPPSMLLLGRPIELETTRFEQNGELGKERERRFYYRIAMWKSNLPMDFKIKGFTDCFQKSMWV